MTRKRVDIVTIKMEKQKSVLFDKRNISTPEDAYLLIRDFIGDMDREYFVVACLNVKNEPTNISVVSIGSLDKTIVHPRDVFKIAILSNASSIIVFHNHPSGDVTPSQPDIDLTKRLVDASKILGIRFLDHLIIGDDDFLSMKEHHHI